MLGNTVVDCSWVTEWEEGRREEWRKKQVAQLGVGFQQLETLDNHFTRLFHKHFLSR